MTETATSTRRRSLPERLVGGPAGFRRRLERLGPTFIKIGQFLALRPDLVPQEYSDELMHLLDRVPPMPWNEARAVLREELKADPGEFFAHINPRPAAAGSLAQAHAARLKDGTEVAVKIQRPGIREKITRDLGRARRLALLLELSGRSFIASPREVVEEFARWLAQEVDFTHELKNLERLYDLAAGSSFQKIPRPYPALSTQRVLTSEFLQGIPVSDLLSTLRSGRDRESGRVLGVDRDRLAANLIRGSLVQIFRYQFFHADLHPGNLIALDEDAIGFVDFGLCAELDETVRERQMRYVAAFYSGDAERMFDAVSDILVPSEETDMDAFRADFLAELRVPISRGQSGRRAREETRDERDRSPIADGMVAMLRTARRHRLHVPVRVLSMYKALLTAEIVAHELGASVDLRSVGREFFLELQRDEFVRAIEPDNLETSFLSGVSFLRDSPGQFRRLLTELSEGRYELNVKISEAPRVRRVRNRRLRLLVTAVLSVSVALLLAAPDLTVALGAYAKWPAWAALALLYLSIFVQWRRLR
ncbi:MAG TPA: AarF/UbiB family protein [Thermoanaerobaculia bacterium]|nr:AarF/UbiB family protein [Thermoanaerobaculia bacterium]